MRRFLAALALAMSTLPASGCVWWWHHPVVWRDVGPYLAPDGPVAGEACDTCAAAHGPTGPPFFRGLAACAGCGDIYWGDWPHRWDILSPCDDCGHVVGPNQLYPGQHWYDHVVTPAPVKPQRIHHIGRGPILERRAVGGPYEFAGPYELSEQYDASYVVGSSDQASEVVEGELLDSAAPQVSGSARRSPATGRGCRSCQQRRGVVRAPTRSTTILR